MHTSSPPTSMPSSSAEVEITPSRSPSKSRRSIARRSSGRKPLRYDEMRGASCGLRLQHPQVHELGDAARLGERDRAQARAHAAPEQPSRRGVGRRLGLERGEPALGRGRAVLGDHVELAPEQLAREARRVARPSPSRRRSAAPRRGGAPPAGAAAAPARSARRARRGRCGPRPRPRARGSGRTPSTRRARAGSRSGACRAW